MDRWIDGYTHFSPKKYLDFLSGFDSFPSVFQQLFNNILPLVDITKKLSQMDVHNIAQSVLVPLPWMIHIQELEKDDALSLEAANICNQELAGILKRYPDRFFGVGIVSMNSHQTVRESFLNAVENHGLDGVVIFLSPDQLAPDTPVYMTLFELAHRYKKPVWIHPCRRVYPGDYEGETHSMHMIWQSLGWVYDTSVAMIRIAASGVFETYKDLRLITHHHGAMIPSFFSRSIYSTRLFNSLSGFTNAQPSEKLDDIKAQIQNFYCDTASHDFNPVVLQQAIDFFGEDKLIFGTDAPMDETFGDIFIKNAQDSVSALDISIEARNKIMFNNILGLLSSDLSQGNISQPVTKYYDY